MLFLCRLSIFFVVLLTAIQAHGQAISEKTNVFDNSLYSASLAVSAEQKIALAVQYPYNGLYVYSLGKTIQSKAVINGFISPRTVVFSHKENHFYVTDSTRGAVLELVMKGDGFAVQRGIDVGQGAFGMVIHPTKEILYITNPTSGILTVVDMQAGKILKTYAGFKGLQTAIAISRDGRLYVAKSENLIVVYNADTMQQLYEFTGIKGISGITTNKAGTRVYITSTFYNMLFLCATELRNLISSTPVGYMPKALVVAQDERSVLVVNEQDSSVSVVDTQSLSVRRLIPLSYQIAPVCVLGLQEYPDDFLVLDKKMKLLRVSWKMGIIETISSSS